MGLVGAVEREHFLFGAYQSTAGTTRSAELRPELPANIFPSPSSQKPAQQVTYKKRDTVPDGDVSNQQKEITSHASLETLEDDEFGDDNFKDQEVMDAGKIDFSYCHQCPNY